MAGATDSTADNIAVRSCCHSAASKCRSGRGRRRSPMDRHHNYNAATSALTISTYVSAHLTATRDEASRFCSDVTEKALASLEPKVHCMCKTSASPEGGLHFYYSQALCAFLKLVGEPYYEN